MVASHEEGHSHNWLCDLILGGQDGLVNVLGTTLGIPAASRDVQVLLAASLAATFAEGVSMGAVAYASSMAQADHYQGERLLQQRMLHEDPSRAREGSRASTRPRDFGESSSTGSWRRSPRTRTTRSRR